MTAQEAAAALEKRKHALTERAEDINALCTAQGGKRLPPQLHPVFRHSLSYMKGELEFIDSLLQEL